MEPEELAAHLARLEREKRNPNTANSEPAPAVAPVKQTPAEKEAALKALQADRESLLQKVAELEVAARVLEADSVGPSPLPASSNTKRSQYIIIITIGYSES